VRRRAATVLLAGLGALAAAAPASAAPSTPRQVAEALRSDPVYVHPRARPRITTAEAGRLRLRILRRDLGRIKVAILPARSANRVGGIAPLANAIDQRLRAKGTLIVSAGSGLHVIVSYPNPEAALGAVRGAVRAHARDGLAPKLLEAVDRVAEVDPGPQGDLAGPGDPAGTVPAIPVIPNFPDPEKVTDDFFDAFKLGLLIVVGIIALPILLGVFRVWRGAKRASEEAAEELDDDRKATRDELIALGDRIRALDLDFSMPGADATARREYEQALAAYEKADQELGRADSARRLARAKSALAEGRRHMDAAQARLAAPAPPSLGQ
jgi:hypothetical protein